MLERFLNFLRNFPSWIILVALFGWMALNYKLTGEVTWKEWGGLILASLFTILTPKGQQQTNVNADSIQADVKADSVAIAPTEDTTKPEAFGAFEVKDNENL